MTVFSVIVLPYHARMGRETKVYFADIYIIESLNEYHTGRRLFDEIQPISFTVKPPVEMHFRSVQTREEFLGVIQGITEITRLQGRIPLLHIEAHGSENGIGMASGEFVAWSDFQASLTAINVMTNLNLFVMLAACSGGYLVKIVQATDRAPVRAIIGPTSNVAAGDIEKAMLAFYRTLFSVGDAVAAFRAMNQAVGAGQMFKAFSADLMFRLIFRGYVETLCTETELDRRESAIIAAVQRKGLGGEELEEYRRRLRSYQRDHRARFNEFKSSFFFCDLYPENDDRFDFTFDDCFKNEEA